MTGKTKPLCIIPFQTGKGNKYIFDGVTNSVFATDEIIDDCIHMFGVFSKDEVKEKLFDKYGKSENVDAAVSFVDKMIRNKKAFYKTSEMIKHDEKHIDYFNEYDIKECLYQLCLMEQIVLNVTENCNLRCKYCFFSEPYENTRNRTSKMMTEEVAFRSLDFYFDRMKEIRKRHPGKIAAVTFYGGEPLMNFELIKKCTEYIKNKYPYKCELSITTNGVLLDDEKAEFLHENGFTIAVSLDGNKENHDRNRITSDGTGSFDIVYRNIKAFQKKYPDYERFKLTGVFDYNTKLMENNEFFCNEELPGWVFINQVSNKDTLYYDKFDQKAYDRFSMDYGEALKRYFINKVQGKPPKEYIDFIAETGVAGVLTRLGADDRKLPFLPYTGACVPGVKISVSVDGEFYICEKMDCLKSIGSYKKGLEYEKIVEIIKDYNRTVMSECSKCPIYRTCSICYATTGTKDGFKKPDCKERIESFVAQLIAVYTILEYNPKAFDHFSEKIEWLLNY